jgi:hypothetical protein
MTTTTQYPPYIVPRTEPLAREEQRSRQEISKFLIDFASTQGKPLSKQAIEFLNRHGKGEYDIDSRKLNAHVWKKKQRR